MQNAHSPFDDRSRPVQTVVFWAALWAVALFALYQGSASVALIDPDEGRNAEVAREMMVSGNYVVPHLNDLPYLDKPVFFFAAAATAIKRLLYLLWPLHCWWLPSALCALIALLGWSPA